MTFNVLKVAGVDAVQILNDHRSRYVATGEFPFLIGDSNELDRLRGGAEANSGDSAAIIRASFGAV